MAHHRVPRLLQLRLLQRKHSTTIAQRCCNNSKPMCNIKSTFCSSSTRLRKLSTPKLKCTHKALALLPQAWLRLHHPIHCICCSPRRWPCPPRDLARDSTRTTPRHCSHWGTSVDHSRCSTGPPVADRVRHIVQHPLLPPRTVLIWTPQSPRATHVRGRILCAPCVTRLCTHDSL